MCRHLRSELRAAAQGLQEHKERGLGEHQGFRECSGVYRVSGNRGVKSAVLCGRSPGYGCSR